MRSVNKVILIGNLTRDPEMRQTANGQTVTTFCIATNREWVTKDGQKHSLAEYHDIVAWARLAEICSNYLKKGKLVFIEGYLKTRSWDTPEGTKKFRTEIVAQDMIMLEKRPKDEDYIPEEESLGEAGGAAVEKAEKEVKAEKAPKEEKEEVEKKEKKEAKKAEKEEKVEKAEAEPAAEEEEEKEEEKKSDVDIAGDLGL